MPEVGKIYETINNVMGEIGSIGKNKRSQQGFNYRGVDDVMNALAPAFIKYKLFVVPQVLEQNREERSTTRGGMLIYSICKILYTFYAEDGSHVEVVTIGEGMDSGDKATNKAMAIAFKYACFQIFCIPTEEMADPDAEGHKVEPKGKEKPKQLPKESLAPVTAGKTSAEKESVKRIIPEEMNAVRALIEKYSSMGVKIEKILKMYQIKDLSEMSQEQYTDCMKKLKLYEKEEPAHEQSNPNGKTDPGSGN